MSDTYKPGDTVPRTGEVKCTQKNGVKDKVTAGTKFAPCDHWGEHNGKRMHVGIRLTPPGPSPHLVHVCGRARVGAPRRSIPRACLPAPAREPFAVASVRPGEMRSRSPAPLYGVKGCKAFGATHKASTKR